MTLLYVFPHPDDESFGPAPGIAQEVREGHAVHVLTLTRGGATKERHRLGLSVEEMGDVRRHEMDGVARALGLDTLAVLDFPDGGMAALDPRTIEAAVRERIEAVRPDVLVTYAVHGNSVHPDHLVTHAVVKRVFCEMRAAGGPRRLALFTLVNGEMEGAAAHLRGTAPEEIGAKIHYTPEDRARAEAALACYVTYADVVAAHDPLGLMDRYGISFILFDEPRPEPALERLTDALPAAA